MFAHMRCVKKEGLTRKSVAVQWKEKKEEEEESAEGETDIWVGGAATTINKQQQCARLVLVYTAVEQCNGRRPSSSWSSSGRDSDES